jgi:hypothetical protein
MLYLLGLYLFIGIIQTIILMVVLNGRGIVISKEDKTQLFTLCAILTVAYPYLAIRSTYKKFTKNKTQVIDVKEFK